MFSLGLFFLKGALRAIFAQVLVQRAGLESDDDIVLCGRGEHPAPAAPAGSDPEIQERKRRRWELQVTGAKQSLLVSGGSKKNEYLLSWTTG